MTRLSDLPTPALLVDLDRLDDNIRRMARRAAVLGVALRPHVKTHKCVEIARRQRRAGCRGLTVSTLYEARVFAEAGFDDLTWAFPLILNRIDEARALAERITLRLVVDSEEAIDALEATGFPFHVWLKVDCGYHRAGVDPEGALAPRLARRLADSRRLRFDGLLTHSGQAYRASPGAKVLEAAERERSVMTGLAARLRASGVAVPGLSVGSTPAMAVVPSLAGIDEARPGNYVFYDLMQVALGSCAPTDCALTVLASVVSSQPQARHCVVDAGALALSKDDGAGPGGASRTMGAIFGDYAAGRLVPAARLSSLSQEHGVVAAPLALGRRVRILPNHACLTAACFEFAEVVRGDRVVDRWRIWSGR